MEQDKPNEELQEKLKAEFERTKTEVIKDNPYFLLSSCKLADDEEGRVILTYMASCPAEQASETILSIVRIWKEKGYFSYVLLVTGVLKTLAEDISVDELNAISDLVVSEIKSRESGPEIDISEDMAQEVAKILRGIGNNI